MRGFKLIEIGYALAAIVAVALAANVRTDAYVSNILMQAATYAIAVFGLSIVLGLCGQINLAQAAFFALGAYAVGLGTVDYHLPFWLCLAAGVAIALLAGAGLGVSTLRLGGHYLAMVTISFQQILTVVLINAISLTHGPDGISSIPRPAGFSSSQAFLALAVAAFALSGYFVWRLPDTRLGRAMRAVRDNELAASAAGVDVFRTKVFAFALCAASRRARRRIVRGRLCLCQPGPVRLRRFDRAADHGAARRRRLADRFGDRHGIVDSDPRMAALPEERARALSRDLRPSGHLDCDLHA